MITLHRFKTGPEGTFGRIFKDGIPLCVTCEDPWKNNKTGESCIPAGTYKCVPHNGAKYKNVWEITHVPGRSAILIHNGNTINDTQGCVLVGESFGNLDRLPAVVGSRAALRRLRAELPPEFDLKIEEAYV